METITKEVITEPYWNLAEEEDEEAFCLAQSVLLDSIKFDVLKAVIDLQVLEIIKNCGPQAHLSATEIAAKLPTDNVEGAATTLGRLLELLVSHSILTVSLGTLPQGSVERRYGLAPLCKFLTSNQEAFSLAPFSSTSLYRPLKESCLCLKNAVLEGGNPFKKAHGMSLYEYMRKDSAFCKDFQRLMSNHSNLVMHKIIEKYKGFEGVSSLIDVGGGHGTTLNIILTRYPSIKGINFDQPHVIQDAPSYPGLEHVGGDMFVNIPKGEAIFLKWICHNYDDEKCISILQNCYAALPENHGKVIICESVLPEPHQVSWNVTANSVVQFDMLMMVFPEGKQRTQEEFKVLAFAAGFQAFQVVCSAYNLKIMELLKEN